MTDTSRFAPEKTDNSISRRHRNKEERHRNKYSEILNRERLHTGKTDIGVITIIIVFTIWLLFNSRKIEKEQSNACNLHLNALHKTNSTHN